MLLGSAGTVRFLRSTADSRVIAVLLAAIAIGCAARGGAAELRPPDRPGMRRLP